MCFFLCIEKWNSLKLHYVNILIMNVNRKYFNNFNNIYFRNCVNLKRRNDNITNINLNEPST